METETEKRDGPSLLIVDDGQLNRHLASRFFQRMGCEVALAESAEEAVAALRETRFDMVVTDIMMPGVSGTEAAPLYRSAASSPDGERGNPLWLVAMSGAALGDDVAAYQAAGFDDYLAKPITVQSATAMLARWRTRGSLPPTCPSP